MKTTHVRRDFLRWQEERLPAGRRRQIEEHLSHCEACRRYFQKMAMAVGKAETPVFYELQPDPYLASRIIAQQGRRRGTSAEKPRASTSGWRWALSSAMAAMALLIGIYLGSRLADVPEYSETQIASAYYQAFAQPDYATTSWAAELLQEGEERQ